MADAQVSDRSVASPGWLDAWYSFTEREGRRNREGPVRQQWQSNATFILAAIGAAIGLGNFWRFPYLTAKHGGAWFFLPWLTCLLVLGIPFMVLEIGLGQKF